ncbi:uncharacterized protein At2g39795, mitochondrial-like [Magnolia sinica]|uniref:uncharacterized protein At2g39795, mitochondrial-like n=1 Tax=Magnolia sinica TaxID=86752 RepID=UPI00265959BB|nr:uncharacterized protein At2g39795, mitochondrial-like [Magnolia sinica]
MSSAMSYLLRKSLRFSLLPSLASKQHQSLSFSSSISSSSSSPLLRRIPQNPVKPPPPFLSSFRFASSGKKPGADEKLKLVLDSEIKCAEESDDLDQGLPDVSPFEIVDNPGEQTVTLKREFMGESIQVEVHMSDLMGEEDEEDKDDADSGDDNEENSSQPNVSLIVTISKGEGPSLEFCCTTYPDKFTIDSMLMKGQQVSDDQIAYEGPEFSDLDDNLQKAFYKYLEARGIKSSLTNSLQEYMVNKDNREYLRWLKNMKDFVEN